MVGKTEEVEAGLVTHPSTAGERSGLLLPLDRYLLWLCRRGGRPGPQCSPDPSRPPIGPPKPAGTDPPIGPPPNPPRSLRPPKRPPGSRGSESGVSPSVNGRSSNNRCHSYRDVRIGQGRRQVRVGRKRDFQAESGIEDRRPGSTVRKEGTPTKKLRRLGQQKGEWRRRQGKKKTHFIKTHKMVALNGCLPSLPHPILPKIP